MHPGYRSTPFGGGHELSQASLQGGAPFRDGGGDSWVWPRATRRGTMVAHNRFAGGRRTPQRTLKEHAMPRLPAGTITFLFTDVDAGAGADASALTRQDTIVREAIQANDGYPYKTVGYGLQAAFHTAPQAIAGALAAQVALAAWNANPERPGPEVRVGMALHTGVAEVFDGEYSGPLLNRVARMLAACHG